MQVLLAAGNGELMHLDVDKKAKSITVRVERSKIMSLGKKAISDFLLKLHVWRSTADVEAAEDYFGSLTAPNDEWLDIRDVVLSYDGQAEAYAQPNTFLEDGKVLLKEYDATFEGVIHSWFERQV
jgi:dipeptidyl-peptidase-3